MKKNSNKKVSPASLIALAKACFAGILSAEAVYFSLEISFQLKDFLVNLNREGWILIIAVFCLLIMISYMIIRGLFPDILRILISWRLDIFLIFGFGIYISIFFSGIGASIYKYAVSLLKPEQLLVLIFIPISFALLFELRLLAIKLFKNKTKIQPFFVNDDEQEFKKDDLLGFSLQAEIFAERVFNQGSSDSLVFGIDAPWGIGKSTFVNFCIEYWNKNHNNIIIYKFSPLRYENRAKLLEKFIDGLICVIQKNVFAPEIRPLISKYSRFIKGTKGAFSLYGINFEIFSGTYTMGDAFEDLEVTISNLNKKIIVIVDDLDRLNFSAIKDVLFTIKKSFTLPDISYVLCYDTENIVSFEKENPGIEKITEFLEKFVNVKVSLYLDSSILLNFITENLAKTLSGNSQADPNLVSKAIGGVLDIFKSNDYHLYLPFISDVRKLKRLINIVLLLDIEKTDFDNSDFNKQDLIHLLLIYINYPNIFRKIYNTETAGKRGFFSVVLPYEDNYPVEPSNQFGGSKKESHFKNSKDYYEYFKGLSESQQFLLHKIFNVNQRIGENTDIDSVSQDIKNSYACFNGDGGWSGGRNLEQYLNLIVKLSKPPKDEQYMFYRNLKDEILNGKSVDDILSMKELSFSKGESGQEQFWRVIINSLSEFDNLVGSKLIAYIVENIPNYSFFNDKKIGVGLRDDMDFFLISLLDRVGWSDQNGKHSNNSEENISEIAEWIFGENRHAGNSILEILSEEGRGVLGFYDLLTFRLACSADRGGDIFNLERALSKHGDIKAPTQGDVSIITIEEMREISQKIFSIFKSQYIEKKINLFESINNLSLSDLAGKCLTYIEGKIESGDVENSDNRIYELKSRIKSFIIYQLGNSIMGHGIGCGYYNQDGKEDKNGIKDEFNKYLFGQCFNLSVNQTNYEHFLDYLLINLARTTSVGSDFKYIPHINEFTNVLSRDMLAKYWENNCTTIKALNLNKLDKQIITPNYIATYKTDLDGVYNVLDKLTQESEDTQPKETKA